MVERKCIPMKPIIPPMSRRTESYKTEDKDKVKSSVKPVQFVDDFPSTSSMIKAK